MYGVRSLWSRLRQTARLVALAAVALTLGAAEWERARAPSEAGWSAAKLEAARDYASTIQTAAVVIVNDGRIVYEWGQTSKPFMCHSMRKSILSALYGPHVADGRIDLSRTLADLGIDDTEPSLTETERQATIGDLIKARSGIYHAALYESPGMTASKPLRGSHPPGTFWHYNNWDFNALGTVFENLTGRSLYEEFEDRLAGPLGMQDFHRTGHTGYYTGPQSVHPAYPFILSACDLARFGLLFLQQGRWDGEQIIPAEWVAESTATHSKARGWDGYAYMWWTTPKGRPLDESGLPAGAYSARGFGGHYVYVIPAW
ncbi:MAG: serine hydrolase, partial [bacterium]|nr:serine hydrolase [bacterium]